jgi:hypothetical protein
MYLVTINDNVKMTLGKDHQEKTFSEILAMVEKLAGAIRIRKVCIEIVDEAADKF